MITSGMTSGAYTIPENRVRPANRPCLARAKAAIVPKIVATEAERKATFRVIHAASSNCWLEKTEAYHFVDHPPHTATLRPALNE